MTRCPALLLLPILLLALTGKSQQVGVVLSGGGSSALAHVGFLRALEENDIPIDYIGGTSMGAVIAAMYASGYSPAIIDSLVRTTEFLQMARGEIDDLYQYYFKSYDTDASMANFKYSKGQFITSALPTYLVDPVLLDWKFMEGFTQPGVAAGENFDSLYIPFRCIAAEVSHKREVIFRDGPLDVAVRASCTYPFYLPPRRIRGELLYDGGIYNNFPANVIYRDFLPDVIIGCNVSENNGPASEDNILSQLQSMIVGQTDFDRLCEQMIIVHPATAHIGTFDFAKGEEAIGLGYEASTDSMPAILALIERRVTHEEKMKERLRFMKKFQPIEIASIQYTGLNRQQEKYVSRVMRVKNMPAPLSTLKPAYFRLFMDDKIKSVIPGAFPGDGGYELRLDVRPEKDVEMAFGGNFSSRSINTGFIGLRYNLLGTTSATLSANSYFGRLYGSVNTNLRWDVPGAFPFSVQASFTINRWDYYKSLTTFFEDVKPSFVVLYERFGGLTLRFPAGNKGMIKADALYGLTRDRYYQTSAFLSTDTADQTRFRSGALRITWDRNTLDRKQYASKGTRLKFSVKAVTGREATIPGSTSILRDTIHLDHQWLLFRARYTNYFFQKGPVGVGLHLEACYSNQDFFENYISSAIMAPVFEPLPESPTLFLPQFRSHAYTAAGMEFILRFARNLEWRMQGHIFGDYQPLVSDALNQARYSDTPKALLNASAAVVMHSPLGPLSLSANYYDQREEPWSVLFNFGYLLYNGSSRD